MEDLFNIVEPNDEDIKKMNELVLLIKSKKDIKNKSIRKSYKEYKGQAGRNAIPYAIFKRNFLERVSRGG